MTNHFLLLGLPFRFDLDYAALEANYFSAQQQFHPDRFVAKSSEERIAAAQQSANINQAYQTLKHPLARAQYLLSLEGIRVGTDSDTAKPSQALLMETIEWRERMEEGGDIKTELEVLYQASFAAISQAYDNRAFDTMAQEALRLGYIIKTLEELKKKH